MPITDYHAKYLAYELTRRCPSDSVEKLAGAVAGAQVDLNPHQVDAALFAFNSPLTEGALLADQFGLDKTIDAALVLSQHWAVAHSHKSEAHCRSWPNTGQFQRGGRRALAVRRPAQAQRDFARVQHFILLSGPHGMFGFVLANGSMFFNHSGAAAPSSRPTSWSAWCALPGQLLYSTQIPVHSSVCLAA